MDFSKIVRKRVPFLKSIETAFRVIRAMAFKQRKYMFTHFPRQQLCMSLGE